MSIKEVDFLRFSFYLANQSNLIHFKKALIGWNKAGPPKKPLWVWTCKQANTVG